MHRSPVLTKQIVPFCRIDFALLSNHLSTPSPDATDNELSIVVVCSDGRLLDRSLTSWDADGMTQGARRLIEEFDALPEQERSEVLTELARRVGLSPHDLPRNEDLLAAADQLFVELDQRESTE